MAAPKPSYQELNGQLEALLSQLQSDQIDIDQAVIVYEQAMKVLKKMEAHLKAAKNNVHVIKARFDGDSD